MIRRVEAKLRWIKEVGKVRDLQKCPTYKQSLRIPCSFPTEYKCRNIIYVDEKNSYVLCAYRVRDLGLDTCLKEAEALIGWNAK